MRLKYRYHHYMRLRSLFPFLLGVALTSSVFSQSPEGGPDKKALLIGLRISPGWTWDQFGSYENLVRYEISSRTVINGGIETTFALSRNKWFIEVGIIFTDFGFREKRTEVFPPTNEVWYIVEKNRYISMPVSVIRRFNNAYIGLGPVSSFFINRQVIINGEEFDRERPLYFRPGRNAPWSHMLYGLQLKAGMIIPLGSQWQLRPEAYFNGVSAMGGFGFYNSGVGVAIDRRLR